MKKKKIRAAKKGNKTPWKEPDFEIYSLLDKNLYLRGVFCNCYDPGDCSSDPAGS